MPPPSLSLSHLTELFYPFNNKMISFCSFLFGLPFFPPWDDEWNLIHGNPGGWRDGKAATKMENFGEGFRKEKRREKKAKKSIWRQGRNQIINFNSFLFPSMLRHRNRVIYVVLWLLKGTSKRHKLIESVETWRWNGGCCCCCGVCWEGEGGEWEVEKLKKGIRRHWKCRNDGAKARKKVRTANYDLRWDA